MPITRKYWPTKLVAKTLGCNSWTIRFWEKEAGMIVRRSSTDQRMYTAEQVQFFANQMRFRSFTRAQLINYITEFGG